MRYPLTINTHVWRPPTTEQAAPVMNALTGDWQDVAQIARKAGVSHQRAQRILSEAGSAVVESKSVATGRTRMHTKFVWRRAECSESQKSA